MAERVFGGTCIALSVGASLVAWTGVWPTAVKSHPGEMLALFAAGWALWNTGRK